MNHKPTQRRYWLDNPRNVNRIVWALAAICVLLVGAELFYEHHAHYAWENWFGFHAWFGFVTFFGLVLLGKQFRKLVKRDEDYYERDR